MASVSLTKVWAEEKGAKIVHSTVLSLGQPFPTGLLLPMGERGGVVTGQCSLTLSNPITQQVPTLSLGSTRHLAYITSFRVHNKPANGTFLSLLFYRKQDTEGSRDLPKVTQLGNRKTFL